MNDLEFEQVMRIVTGRWSEKAYPHPVVQRIWYFVKDLPRENFEIIVFKLLDSARAAPMPNEFRTLAYIERDRLGISRVKEPETKPSSEAKCWDCGDSGNLFATHKQNKSSATFRCHCPAGTARPASQGAQWNAKWEAVYEKDPVYLGLKGNWAPREGLSLVTLVKEMACIRASDEIQNGDS